MAYYEDSTQKSANIIEDEGGNSCVSPCVAFTDDGGVLVGDGTLSLFLGNTNEPAYQP